MERSCLLTVEVERDSSTRSQVRLLRMTVGRMGKSSGGERKNLLSKRKIKGQYSAKMRTNLSGFVLCMYCLFKNI